MRIIRNPQISCDAVFIFLYVKNYLQVLAQGAVCQSHTGHMTGLWFLPSPAFKVEY